MADQDCVKLDWGHHVLLTLYQVIYICNCSLNYRIQTQSRGFLVAHYERLVKCVAEETGQGTVPSSLKILSYNVWFREDLEMHKRMKALGDLIQLHSPELICFQAISLSIFPSHLFNFVYKYILLMVTLLCRRLLLIYMIFSAIPAGGRYIIAQFQLRWQTQDLTFACW